ncbi:hypothetical protein CYY_003853 [Polysphondylium violaceum]|uniref:ILEI/PANDER domain-containing protein n=1 Tax=Polysphondylium violaceum TaxID=133409 RepID=A0A8J4PVJ7_9MYCE|nr:hypothetical protein CYY_003853 [Polysphondylium violaceum]
MNLQVTPTSFIYDGNSFSYDPLTFNIFVYSPQIEPPIIVKQYEVQNAEFMIKFIDDIGIGCLVVATILHPPSISDGIKFAFQTIGSRLIYKVNNTKTLSIAGHKGASIGTAHETWTNGIEYVDKQDETPIDFIEFGTNATSPFFSINGTEMDFNFLDGLNVLFLNYDLQVTSFRHFGFDSSPDSEITNMINYISSLSRDSLVCIISNSIPNRTNMARLSTFMKDTLKSEFFASFLLTFGQKFAFLGELKGRPLLDFSCISQEIRLRYYPRLADTRNPLSFSTCSFNSPTSSNNSVFTTLVYGRRVHSNTWTAGAFSMTFVQEVFGETIGYYEVIPDSKVSYHDYQIYRGAAIALLHNSIQAGTILLLAGSNILEPLSDDFVNALTTYGAALSHQVGAGKSYALIGRKGAARGSVPESISSTGAVGLYTTFNIPSHNVKPYIEVKVTGTYEEGSPYFSINDVKVRLDCKFGWNMMTINSNTGQIKSIGTYQIENEEEFYTALQNIQPGDLLGVVYAGKISSPCPLILQRKLMEILPFRPVVTNHFPAYCFYVAIGVAYEFPSMVDTFGPGCVWYRMPNFAICSFNQYGQPITTSNDATTIYDYIDKLEFNDIVVMATTANTQPTVDQSLAIQMIGASKLSHARRQNIVKYMVIGRKGYASGTAMEYYSLDKPKFNAVMACNIPLVSLPKLTSRISPFADRGHYFLGTHYSFKLSDEYNLERFPGNLYHTEPALSR